MKKVIVIGAGISGLSAACYMAAQGHEVTVLEKNDSVGGRARRLKKGGFTFDMGPTFYWMPDIFERFFADFGKKPSEYYRLVRLDPGYEIYFGAGRSVAIPSGVERIIDLFENYEPGSGKYLTRFLRTAEHNYRIATEKAMYAPGKSPLELVMPETASRLPQFFVSIGKEIDRHIRRPELRHILKFPSLFLGAVPQATPSFYRFMNYADMVLGTWHIRGGMSGLAEAMRKLALELGAEIHTGAEVRRIVTGNGRAEGVVTANGNGSRNRNRSRSSISTGIARQGQAACPKEQAENAKGTETFRKADVIISGADYRHTESLLPPGERNYTDRYWESRVMAPSALLYYTAFDKKLKNVSHHTLFFDTDFDLHAEKIYGRPGWPQIPMFYASFPTKTDPSMGPEGKEGAVFLIPVAAGLQETPFTRERYFRQIISRMEKLTGQSLRNHILFNISYAGKDFIRDYNAYKGNAYGLANILRQTAYWKPSVGNKKIKNLFYTGQLTVPGPGVPPALVSGKIAAAQARSYLTKHR